MCRTNGLRIYCTTHTHAYARALGHTLMQCDGINPKYQEMVRQHIYFHTHNASIYVHAGTHSLTHSLNLSVTPFRLLAHIHSRAIT